MSRTMPELLAPAGTADAFRAALAAGADAIYCALGSSFNARRSADNFDEESFAACVAEAHVAGARVYVTINIAIAQDEMRDALALIARASQLGADAFIIQDWGLLAAVHELWPQVECHISTQANVHDVRGALLCERLGATRVTLSRELSIPEMAAISTTGVETEVFGHGAICFCYSGVCMLSSLSGDRSANRGLCAQPCRLLWELVDDSGMRIAPAGWDRPLCPRDACSIDHLAELAEAGVGSLKVEGRMKAPEYVHEVIGAYRRAMDACAAGEAEVVGEGERRALKRAFNRDFTDAYLVGTSGNEMMSYERSNNRGETVGEVVGSRELPPLRVRAGGANGGRERTRTQTRAEVDVVLSEPVGARDLIELRDDDDPDAFLTGVVHGDAAAGETITLMCARPMPAGARARVIRSQAALDRVRAALSREVARPRPVDVFVTARLGEPFEIELTCDDVRVAVSGEVVEAARTRAVTDEDLAEHVGRMGGTPFEMRSFVVEMDDGIGMSFSAVHRLRARACEELAAALVVPALERGASLAAVPDGAGLRELASRLRVSEPAAGAVDVADVELCALVASPEAARAAAEAGAVRVYASCDALDERVGEWPEGVIPVADEVCREADVARLDAHVRAGEAIAVGNVSTLEAAREAGAPAEVRSCVPVHNAFAAAALERMGASGLWLSPELALDQIAAVCRGTALTCGLMVSGRVRAMTSEHCVLQVADACVHDCARCRLRERDLGLRNRFGEVYPVRTDVHGRSRIYAGRPLDLTEHLPELIGAGVRRVLVDATLLDVDACAAEVTRVREALIAISRGQAPARALPGTTTGHLFSRVR